MTVAISTLHRFFARHGITRKKRQATRSSRIAARIGMENWKVRPRLSELHRDGAIIDSGRRVFNASGRKATVWVAAVFAGEASA